MTHKYNKNRKEFRATNKYSQDEIEIPDGDIRQGEKFYNQSCSGCHSLEHSGLMGPALEKIFMKKSATVKGLF